MTTPSGETPITPTLTAPPTPSTRTPLRAITDQLMKIGTIVDSTQKGLRYPRYISLEKNEIFDALVNLYSVHFKAKWHLLSTITDGITIPRNLDPSFYLARVYISHWFIDLYVCIRDACAKHSLAQHTDYYEKVKHNHSTVYDNFLVLLLNTIRPTHIQGLQEDSLYIPVITAQPNWTGTRHGHNYFTIRDYTYNVALFSALIRVMNGPDSPWLMNTVSSDALGRPTWLFDWHKENNAYAWFPETDNYNADDVTLALILGVACTPHLTSRDEDIPQQFEDNIIVPLNIENLVRVTDKRFQSMIDYRTYEVVYTTHVTYREEQIPMLSPRHAQQGIQIPGLAHSPQDPVAAEEARIGEETSAIVPIGQASSIPKTQQIKLTTRFNEYKIIDFKYYAKVIRINDLNVRAAAHKILIFKD
nr:putative CP [Rhodiola cryptic virus 2]